MIRRLIILLLIVGCDNSTESNKHGCLDGQANNYDATASIDNNTCTYIDSCGVIDIDITNDCVKDECGVWGGHSSGTCSPDTKASLNTKELCESADGLWMPNCN